MSDEFEAIKELDAAREPEIVPNEAHALSDDTMAQNAANVSTEEFLAFTERVNQAAKDAEERPAFGPKDIVRDSIFFVFVVAGAFGWLMLMLLIISFMSLGYLHFNINVMIVSSIIFAVLVGIFYVIMTLRKYNKLRHRD